MMQPFEIFKEVHLEQMLRMKRLYFVTQTYTRAINHIIDEGRIALLLTDYDDKGPGLIHYNAVRRKDQFGYMLDMTKEEHLTKLKEMIAGDKYRLYWAVVKSSTELEQRIAKRYKPNIRRYILAKMNWRIAGDDSVKIYPTVRFGELFVKLVWRTRTETVKFEEIEKS